MRKTAVVLIAVMFMLSACATLHEMSKSPILVQYAIKKAVRAFLGDKSQVWARSVYSITGKAIEEIDKDRIITIPDLEYHIKKQIEWDKLYPEDQELINILIASVKLELNNMVKDNELPADTKMKIKNVLIWIRDTARGFITVQVVSNRRLIFKAISKESARKMDEKFGFDLKKFEANLDNLLKEIHRGFLDKHNNLIFPPQGA